MKPLFDLLKKDNHFLEFLALRKVLAHYDPLKELHIFTDASQKGYAGILCQKFGTQFRPIMYWSKSRPSTKRNHSSCLIELQAGILFMRKIKHYMLGNKTIWYTDSKSLSQILEKSDDIKYSSYTDKIQHYNIEVKHVPGTNNTVADLLSRCDYFQKKCKDFEEIPEVNFIFEIDLIGEQGKIEKLLKSIPEVKKIYNVFRIYEKEPDGTIKFKPFLPDQLLEPICLDAHKQGHYASQKMEPMIRQCLLEMPRMPI
uniref:RT_RNaseH_2 domain-containing protein n=1 Tax=Strongyloides venezuelensis TaxID=75913 RepID=A0A0K0FFV8_STRVS